ncbi:EAL domain-containing protein [Minwuia sp.]|uniref:sensor domain-containing phosphodiesterase n=1 Tax=Minwuia sp. TaxID=2493630 RepID=UPI003A90F1F3
MSDLIVPKAKRYGNARRALGIVRAGLDMDLAYLSRIEDDNLMLEILDRRDILELALQEGDRFKLQDTYTPYILRREIPSVMPDTALQPLTNGLAVTHSIPIGAHISSPVILGDGTVFGLLCCASAAPRAQMTVHDLRVLSLFADMIAYDIDTERAAESELDRRNAIILEIIDQRKFSFFHQEIWDMDTSKPVGAECLARIAQQPAKSPDFWFNEAASLGLGPRFEMATIETALATLPALPRSVFLSVNASPHAILDDRFEALFSEVPLSRIVVEITEHQTVENYRAIARKLDPLRRRGLRLAVDDAGAGYASLFHILELHPDIIKLDAAIIHGSETDLSRKALISAMVTYAYDVGVEIVAEGVETELQKEVLQGLGVRLMQGFALSVPGPVGNNDYSPG